ncbi:hypothetical protein ACIZ62_12060 [Acetobacterium carbinolicum]|uniref:hypothetical protein n=1 Tax=Acetobacterium carbinolicum TaxID=52690 RepID=UPI0039BF15ED
MRQVLQIVHLFRNNTLTLSNTFQKSPKGGADKFDVYYQVHVQNFGCLDWTKNDDSAGTAGFGYRLEAINIVVVPKDASGPGTITRPVVQK